MRRFRFQLEPILRIRKRREEDVKRQLGRKNREIVGAKQDMASLEGELKGLQSGEKLRRARNEADLQAMRASVLYRHKLKRDMVDKGNEILHLNGEAQSIRHSLTRAMQARRAIELVRERRLSEWKREANREEQAFIDDVSQQGHIRKTRGGPRD